MRTLRNRYSDGWLDAVVNECKGTDYKVGIAGAMDKLGDLFSNEILHTHIVAVRLLHLKEYGGHWPKPLDFLITVKPFRVHTEYTL